MAKRMSKAKQLPSKPREGEGSNKPAFAYYKGVKQPLKKAPKLTRNVINKTFRTDEELTEFIFTEGTFKDRITAMTLLTIKETDLAAAKQLLAIASQDEGGDKAYLGITHAIKVVKYYQACQSEISAGTLNDKDAKFVQFVEDIQLVKGVLSALAKQLSSPFLKTKIAQVLKSLIASGTLEAEAVNILMNGADLTILRELTETVEAIVAQGKANLLAVVREKLVQTISHHRNRKTVQNAMGLVFALRRQDWFSTPAEFQEYIVPMIQRYFQVLKDLHDEMNSKQGITSGGLGRVLYGLFRFFTWENDLRRDNPTLPLPAGAKDNAYIIYKMAYHDNPNYSMHALNLLELMHDIDPKINYTNVLVDTMKKYLYTSELERCELLNKAINQTRPEVHDRIISSSYLTEIGGRYGLGCQMVVSECVPEFTRRLGMILHRKSYDPAVVSATASLLRGVAVPVYNLWDTPATKPRRARK